MEKKIENHNKDIEILIVDDEKDFVATMEFWLKSQGYKVRTAFNGKGALDIIKQQKPNIVFLDISMPEMDGVETLRRIREMDDELPVVMITAYGTEENRDAAYRLKANAFFDKSKDFYEADHIIKSILHFFAKAKKEPNK
ncbi:MAG: response regulator [Candidatus Omnitrophica bacterium]|nr:response regulator [Candidatus Omnitrophota bacterium]